MYTHKEVAEIRIYILNSPLIFIYSKSFDLGPLPNQYLSLKFTCFKQVHFCLLGIVGKE